MVLRLNVSHPNTDHLKHRWSRLMYEKGTKSSEQWNIVSNNLYHLTYFYNPLYEMYRVTLVKNEIQSFIIENKINIIIVKNWVSNSFENILFLCLCFTQSRPLSLTLPWWVSVWYINTLSNDCSVCYSIFETLHMPFGTGHIAKSTRLLFKTQTKIVHRFNGRTPPAVIKTIKKKSFNSQRGAFAQYIKFCGRPLFHIIYTSRSWFSINSMVWSSPQKKYWGCAKTVW